MIASELRDARTRLDALSADDAETDVRVVFSWSYQLLSVPARRRFTSHDLIQVCAAKLSAALDADDERHAALGRLLDYHLHRVRGAPAAAAAFRAARPPPRPGRV